MIIVYSFKNDYSEGAHPQILNQILKINAEQNIGYGQDQYSELAKELIKNIIAKKDAAIHFLVGGTQTNLTVMAAFLRPYEAVIAPHTGHILVHETGAIESTGHKIISVATTEGKLTTEQILAVLKEHTDEHMVKPKTINLIEQTITTKDYKSVVVKSVIKYETADVVKLLLEVNDAADALAMAYIGKRNTTR